MSRSSEPSERVAEILDESRDPRPLQLPSTLAGGRYGVSRQAIAGVALVVALAVAMLAGRYVLARDDAAPEPVAVSQGEDSAGSSEGAAQGAAPDRGSPAQTGSSPVPAGEGSASAGASASGQVTVHVVGQVERPGVVVLPSGSRVDDALERAGGATDEADLSSVNLARPVVDGEQVVVPAPGETPVPVPSAAGAPAGAGAGQPAPGGVGGPSGPASLVDLNTADVTTLETLPGVGPVLAQRIVDWRTEHGRFTAVEELGEVSGIGDKIYAQLSSKVTV